MEIKLETEDLNDTDIAVLKALLGDNEETNKLKQEIRLLKQELELLRSRPKTGGALAPVSARVRDLFNEPDAMYSVADACLAIGEDPLTTSSNVYATPNKMVNDGKLDKSSTRPVQYFKRGENPDMKRMFPVGTKTQVMG